MIPFEAVAKMPAQEAVSQLSSYETIFFDGDERAFFALVEELKPAETSAFEAFNAIY